MAYEVKFASARGVHWIYAPDGEPEQVETCVEAKQRFDFLVTLQRHGITIDKLPIVGVWIDDLDVPARKAQERAVLQYFPEDEVGMVGPWAEAAA